MPQNQDNNRDKACFYKNTSLLPIIIIILSALIYLYLAFTLDPRANPDASSYYFTTIMVIKKQFWCSVDGTHSPLLSWLFVPLVWCGIDLNYAIRIVNGVAFISLLIGLRILMKEFLLGNVWQSLALYIISLHLLYPAIALVSPDLLVSALICWLVITLLKQRALASAILAAACYYAKAIELPIILLAFFLYFLFQFFFHFQQFIKKLPKSSSNFFFHLKVIFFTFLFIAPWIALLSIRYQVPTFSGQQHIATQALSLSPLRSDVVFNHISYQAHQNDLIISRILNNYYEYGKRSLSYLFYSGIEPYLSPGGWIIYLPFLILGFIFSLSNRVKYYFLSLIIAQFALYLLIWGPYLRYYYPVIGFLHIFFVLGIAKTFAFTSNFKLSAIIHKLVSTIIALYIGSISYSTINFFSSDKSIFKEERYRELVSILNNEEISAFVSELPDDLNSLIAATSRLTPHAAYLSLRKESTDKEQLATLLSKEDVNAVILKPASDVLKLLDKVKKIFRLKNGDLLLILENKRLRSCP
jgi:hypothetical protein